jgi:hypothetical protein
MRERGRDVRQAGEGRVTDPFFGELAIKVPDVSVVSLGGGNKLRGVASAHHALKVQHRQEVRLLQLVGVSGTGAEALINLAL